MLKFSSTRFQPQGQNRLQGLLERSQQVQQESEAPPPAPPIANGMEFGKGIDGAVYGGRSLTNQRLDGPLYGSGIFSNPTNRLDTLIQDNSYGSPVSGQPYGQSSAYGPMVINPNYNGIPDEYKSPFYPQEIPAAIPKEKSRSSGNSLQKLVKQIPVVNIAKKLPVYKAVKKIGKKLGF